jgi:hypothetical protein
MMIATVRADVSSATIAGSLLAAVLTVKGGSEKPPRPP